LYLIILESPAKVKFWSEMAIGAIRAKLFFNHYQKKNEEIKK
jgi:hypothetical protein